GLRESALSADGDEGAQAHVEDVDALEIGRHQLDGRHAPLADERGLARRPGEEDIVVGWGHEIPSGRVGHGSTCSSGRASSAASASRKALRRWAISTASSPVNGSESDAARRRTSSGPRSAMAEIYSII